MKLYFGLTLVLLVALCHAAPRSPVIVQMYEPTGQVEEEGRPIEVDNVDIWPLEEDSFAIQEEPTLTLHNVGGFADDLNYEAEPVVGSVDLDVNINPDQTALLMNDAITNIIFKDLENRITEDIRRMQEDFLLFQRLFGGVRQRPSEERRPSWMFPLSGFPHYSPEGNNPSYLPDSSEESSESDDDTIFDFNPWETEYDNREDNNDDDSDEDDFSLFSGFPLLGVDRPVLFPGFEDVPGIGFVDPDSLPDNYDNQTHEVHSVDGSRVVVNNTINKETGDDFNTFFHHQVFHVQPEGDDSNTDEEPEAGAEEPVRPVIKVPQDQEDNEDEINDVLPEVENEVSSGNFVPEAIPEVNPEINVDIIPEAVELRHTAPEDEEFDRGSLLSQARKKLSQRSIDGFNPIVFPADDPNARPKPFPGPVNAAYISNSLDDDADFEEVEVEVEDGERRAPDLSNDTRVNRVAANKQGMTRVDPDAEVFDYGLVLKEAQPRDGDK